MSTEPEVQIGPSQLRNSNEDSPLIKADKCPGHEYGQGRVKQLKMARVSSASKQLQKQVMKKKAVVLPS